MKEGFIENHRRKHGEFVKNDTASDKSVVKGILAELNDAMEPVDDGIYIDDASVLLSVIADENEKSLFIGKSAGDEVIFNIRAALPNDTEIASLLRMKKDDVRDVKGNFSFTISEINTFEPAKLDAEFFGKVFMSETEMTESDFYKKIDEEIAQSLSKESDHRFRIDAIEHTVEKSGIELPEEFLKRWLLNVNKELTADQLDKEFDGFKKDMKWQLIRNKIARGNEIKVSEEDLMGEAMAVTRAQFMQYGLYYVTDEQISGYAAEILKKEDEARRLADRVLDTKVVDWIKENVKVDEKKVSSEDFNKLYE
jgi:trigger factor